MVFCGEMEPRHWLSAAWVLVDEGTTELKIPRTERSVPVRVRLRAPYELERFRAFFDTSA